MLKKLHCVLTIGIKNFQFQEKVSQTFLPVGSDGCEVSFETTVIKRSSTEEPTFVTFALKINKIPEFYLIIACKIFFPRILGKHVPPFPCLYVHLSRNTMS